MSSDSTYFDMRATSLKPALQIAFETAPGGKAWGYKSTKDKLVFAWNKNAGDTFVPFVTPIGWEEAETIVKNWCKEVADYGTEPDHDGDNGRSWRIYCEAWGYIDHNHYTFMAVEPYWAEYGK